MVKQCYIDYRATEPVNVSIYADGSHTPYYTFVLPINPNRTEVPMRVRFPAMKLRQFRVIALSTADFQFYNAPQFDQKPVSTDKGYKRSETVTL